MLYFFVSEKMFHYKKTVEVSMSESKIEESGKDEFGVSFSEYPECPEEDCPRDNAVGLNYIGLQDGENPHTRMDGGGTFYCYACCATF